MNIEIALSILAVSCALKFAVFAIKRFWPRTDSERRTDLYVLDVLSNIGIVGSAVYMSFWIIPFVILAYIYFQFGFFKS